MLMPGSFAAMLLIPIPAAITSAQKKSGAQAGLFLWWRCSPASQASISPPRSKASEQAHRFAHFVVEMFACFAGFDLPSSF